MLKSWKARLVTSRRSLETNNYFGSRRYHSFGLHLRNIFGCRVHKIPLDVGFSCPTRDGTLGTEGCIYCGNRGSGTGAHEKGLTLEEQIEKGIEYGTYKRLAKGFIAYFQAYTNTYAPPETLRSLYDRALGYKEIVGLSVGTRPDCVPEPVLDLLEDYSRRVYLWVEYGLQSANDATLRRINRGHDVAQFADAVRRTKARGMKVCAHVILGLPGEKKQDMMATADFLASLGVEAVKIHSLYILKGTRLAYTYMKGEFSALSLGKYVRRVCDFLERLPPEMVIQRLVSDPPGDLLFAPLWCRDRATVVKEIGIELERRDSYQGKLFLQGTHEPKAG